MVSSEKKRKAAELEAQELGGFMDGRARTLGGSPERLLKVGSGDHDPPQAASPLKEADPGGGR